MINKYYTDIDIDIDIYYRYPPPRLARTAFLKFRRQAPLYHLLTYTLVPPYTVLPTS